MYILRKKEKKKGGGKERGREIVNSRERKEIKKEKKELFLITSITDQ